MPPMRQEGWASHEERSERGQSEIRHFVGRVLAPPPVGQGPATTAGRIEKAVQDWHSPVESWIDREWNPEIGLDRGFPGYCCIADSPRGSVRLKTTAGDAENYENPSYRQNENCWIRVMEASVSVSLCVV
jgi:hypothetical protein